MQTFKPLDKMTAVLTAALACNAGGALLAALPDDALDPAKMEGEGAGEQLLKAFALIGVGGAVVIAAVASIVLFLVWMNRAAKNLRVLEPTQVFQFTPGWCVGWWFIPFANFVKPFQAMNEIWRNSDDNAYTVETSPLLAGWWASWIISRLVDRVAMQEHVPQALAWASSFLDIIAVVLCVLVVRRISAMQHARFTRLATTGHVGRETPAAM